jgi:cyclohexyl-isocyanide hydratase
LGFIEAGLLGSGRGVLQLFGRQIDGSGPPEPSAYSHPATALSDWSGVAQDDRDSGLAPSLPTMGIFVITAPRPAGDAFAGHGRHGRLGIGSAEATLMDERRTQIGLLLFPGLTQLDLTGPFEVLARIPDVAVHLVAKTREPVTSDRGLTLLPSTTFDECPDLDVICVPGGSGVYDQMLDGEVLSFLRRQASQARYVTSVCTGALILGAAGLLRGYRATTHWASMEFLESFGATPVDTRVCVDRNRITGGGVTAGIDFGLFLASVLAGNEVAQRIQLSLEYAPEPPFRAGSPASAPAAVVEQYQTSSAEKMDRRRKAVADAAARLAAPERPG